MVPKIDDVEISESELEVIRQHRAGGADREAQVRLQIEAERKQSRMAAEANSMTAKQLQESPEHMTALRKEVARILALPRWGA